MGLGASLYGMAELSLNSWLRDLSDMLVAFTASEEKLSSELRRLRLQLQNEVSLSVEAGPSEWSVQADWPHLTPTVRAPAHNAGGEQRPPASPWSGPESTKKHAADAIADVLPPEASPSQGPGSVTDGAQASESASSGANPGTRNYDYFSELDRKLAHLRQRAGGPG